MTTASTPRALAKGGAGRRHPAWTVAAVTFLALIAAAAFRSSTGVLIEPVENEFGWSRSWTSSAVSLNLVLFGFTAPFAAALMERFGIRRVVAAALTLVALGSGLTLVMTQPWHLLVLWGVVVGFGTGSMAVVLGAVVANRWFVTHRGVVMGVFSAGSATGQLVVLPVVAYLASHAGWRWASGVTALLALAIVPLVLGLVRDRPEDAGVRAYGAPLSSTAASSASSSVVSSSSSSVASSSPVASSVVEEEPGAAMGDQPVPVTEVPVTEASAQQGAGRAALRELARAGRTRAFWVLFLTFFICGWSTNGLIQTHFVPMAHDHGMPPTTAASLLALVGVFDIFGTFGSGWLSDRVDPRVLLFVYYGLRGLALLAGPSVMGARVEPPLLFFIVFYGLDWVATVPPTVALCRQYFGTARSGVIFGWVFAGHMIGAGIAAEVAGLIRETTGSYSDAWWLAGVLCLLAAAGIFGIGASPVLGRAQSVAGEPEN